MSQSTSCCSIKGDKFLVAVDQAFSRETRGRGRYHEIHCPGFFTGVTAPFVVAHERFADVPMSSQALRELSVAMDQPPSKGTRGRRTPITSQTAPGSSSASLLPSWSNRQCPQVVSRRTHEFQALQATPHMVGLITKRTGTNHWLSSQQVH